MRPQFWCFKEHILRLPLVSRTHCSTFDPQAQASISSQFYNLRLRSIFVQRIPTSSVFGLQSLMAAFAASLSSSQALLGLGFNEHWRGKRRQKPRNWAMGSRFLVQNSSLPNEDSAVLRDDLNGGANFQFSSFNGEAADTSTELGAVHKNDGRSQLLRNLSEANQYIRTLQHKLQEKEDALQDTKRDLSAMEKELQTLASITQEISRQGIKPGTRKINGRYIHSHLATRLREMQKILDERVKKLYLVQTRSIDLFYYGMAEDVQVMGSFDGWTRGDQMSPESTGTFTKFTTTMKLRPGRYEIKFLVDGEWHLSPDLPTVGEGLIVNNLLIVDQF